MGTPGEFRPPKYASPQPLGRDADPLPTAGRLVGRWQERYLVHGEGDALGERVRLPLYWWFILNRILEFDPDTGALAHDRVFIGIPKGNDKTEGTARFGVAELTGPIAPLRSPRVVLTAASYDQTRELFTAARLSIVGDPEHERPGRLHPYFAGDLIREDRILLPGGHGSIERLAAVGGTNDGGKPTAHLGDEIHELDTLRKERVMTVQGKSLRKRRVPRRTPAALGMAHACPERGMCRDLGAVHLSGALQVGITTAGFSTDSLAGRLYEHGKKVASGEVLDPGFLFLWWEADEDLNLEDPAQLDQAILQANPAATVTFPVPPGGNFLPIEPIRSSYRDPTVELPEFLRYNLNRWPTDALRWIPSKVWADCAGDPVMRGDLPTYAVVTVAHDHRSASIAVAQLQGDRIVLRVRSFPESPLPEGELVDVGDLEAYLRGLARLYPSQVMGVRRTGGGRERAMPVRGPEIVYHGAFFEGSVQRLRAETLAFVDIPDTVERLAPASEALKAAALEGRLVHDGDAELGRQVGRVLAVPAARGWRVQDAGPAARAAMVAVHRALTMQAPKPIVRRPTVVAGF